MQPKLAAIREARRREVDAQEAVMAAAADALDAGVTQKAVAELLGVDRTTVWRRLNEWRASVAEKGPATAGTARGTTDHNTREDAMTSTEEHTDERVGPLQIPTRTVDHKPGPDIVLTGERAGVAIMVAGRTLLLDHQAACDLHIAAGDAMAVTSPASKFGHDGDDS